jgi:hypothetical protein
MGLRYTPGETASLVSAAAPLESEVRRNAAQPTRQSAMAAQLAFLGALGDVAGATRRISGELSRLKASKWGIAGRHADLFVPFVDHGVQQLRWIDAELAAATRLCTTASEVDDPDMQLALLRLAGPRLEAAMMGPVLCRAGAGAPRGDSWRWRLASGSHMAQRMEPNPHACAVQRGNQGWPTPDTRRNPEARRKSHEAL